MSAELTPARARSLLRLHFGYPDFRPNQRRAIQSLLQGRDTLAILPTGGGKSLCFQIPALMLDGVTIVVSPLISLMQDQVAALRARGIPAASLNSTARPDEQRGILDEAQGGRMRLLYTSPERLKRLVAECRERAIAVALVAVDEAHCIAEWGHDFRPSYRALRHRLTRLGSPPAVALTGSATPAVERDIIQSLGLGRRRPLAIHRGSFDRPNLWFGVRLVRAEAERLRLLLDLIGGDDRMALVYAPTRSMCEALARAITRAGHLALPYHAGLSTARRRATLRRFLDHEVEVVTATSAFGMGIDKSDVRLVVHWSVPPSPEAYYQEAGRAGRDGAFARCILLYRAGDARVHRLQLGVTFPHERVVESVWAGCPPVGTTRNVLESAERLKRELRPERGRVDWRPIRRRRHATEQRISAMERYAKGRGCRRGMLVGYFGERLRTCSGCDRCTRSPVVAGDPPEVLRRLKRLGRALRGRTAPWGGSLLAPSTLRELALHPPDTLEALAAVPGVGPTLVARLGPKMLAVLDGDTAETDPTPTVPLLEALLAWRSGVAGELGMLPLEVIPERTCQLIAEERPTTLVSLAAIPGLGPRCRLKFGQDILRIVQSCLAGGQPLEGAGQPGSRSV